MIVWAPTPNHWDLPRSAADTADLEGDTADLDDTADLIRADDLWYEEPDGA